tara:strand:- start:1492 stop:2052 length:561 start_codon:yes stop_codon:yes gene_type:complete
MKLNHLIRFTPLISTFLLIVFLCFSNQKEYTKLRILIWNTPSITLGRYLAISTGAGFFISYVITSYLAKAVQFPASNSLKFKDNNETLNENDYHEEKIDPSTFTAYEKTLIERDLKDPSPTINASFRIIGLQDRNKANFKVNNNGDKYDRTIEFDQQYDQKSDINENINQVDSIMSDWNDESYSRW